MTEAEAFAQQLARRASQVLSTRRAREDEFSIGRMLFRLKAPDAAGWLGRAFLLGAAHPPSPGDTAHALTVWDGTTNDTYPPDRPWGPSAHEPVGLINDYSDDKLRFAFCALSNSLMTSDLARQAS